MWNKIFPRVGRVKGVLVGRVQIERDTVKVEGPGRALVKGIEVEVLSEGHL